MSSARGKLGEFLREVIDWTWQEFIEAEESDKYTGLQASVFALVRACADGTLSAIKLAIDRVDGKIETPVRVEYPKVFFLYPHADSVAAEQPTTEGIIAIADPDSLKDELPEEPIPEEKPLVTLSLRETLEKMADANRKVPMLVHEQMKAVEHGELGPEDQIPLVKSVIAANLLILANEKMSFDAITEVFDRIDGKLVEVIRMLGDDAYIEMYALQAPAGAVKNKDGVYQIEMPEISAQWRSKLEK